MKPDDRDINQAEHTKTCLITQMIMFKHKWLDETNVDRSKHKLPCEVFSYKILFSKSILLDLVKSFSVKMNMMPCYNLKA